jgi:molybdenum cofactor cytidylyltransferase/nicotine blue oxidoreductase
MVFFDDLRILPVVSVCAAVLAAGAGSRFGAPKATVEVEGRRLVDRAVAVAVAAGCDPVLAVVRAGTAVPDAVVVPNPAPERGMRSSLELAVAAAGAVPALAVLLVDTPDVRASAVRAVAEAWRAGRIAIARYADRRGHPIVMSPQLWRAALEVAGADEGARRFLELHPELVDEVAVLGDPADLDTPDDLARWRARS